jgi:DNA-nicking Smr family endonuclease
MARRSLSREERALWEATTRTVAPLPQRGRAATPEPASRTPTPSTGRARKPIPPSGPAPLQALTPGVASGVDRRTAERQRRGQLPIEARLDLHGLTQDEAHRALIRFVTDAADRGMRNLLVITGKGSASDATGVLKTVVPRWLNERALRPHILSFAWAQPRHGGAGALYVMLRRRR